jgi:hypothetical protein
MLDDISRAAGHEAAIAVNPQLDIPDNVFDKIVIDSGTVERIRDKNAK